jgi:riboflavin synthase
MFTGIIEETGTVLELIKSSNSMKLSIKGKIILEDIAIGDSIAVNGVCVTVTDISAQSFEADVSPETIEKTNIRSFKKGRTVNLERALTMSKRIGGHFVSGHIDGTASIDSIVNEKGFWKFVFMADQSLMKHIASKGSVAVDGVSLTPYDCTKESFSVMIIPHTLDSTALKTLHTSDLVNIECDILSKYIEQLLLLRDGTQDSESSRTIDAEFLKRTGFVI